MKTQAKRVIVQKQEVITKEHYAVSVVLPLGLARDFAYGTGEARRIAVDEVGRALVQALATEDPNQAEVIRV